MKPGRNAPCPCGSGKKLKHCCEGKIASKPQLPAPAEINQLIALFNSGRYVELETQARALVERYPDFGFAWKALGTSLLMQGKDALPALQKAAKLLPDDAEAHYNLGKVLRGLGQFDGAVASYRRALEINPGDAVVHNNLGITLKNLGQIDDAVKSYRRAIKIKPDYAEAYSNLGNALMGLKQLSEAETNLRRAIDIKPDSAEALNNLALFFSEQDRLSEAEISLRRALEIKPDYIDALNSLGNTMQKLKRHKEAVACYQKALAIKPDYVEALIDLGNVFKYQGKLDAAADSYRKALALKPDDAGAHHNLGLTLLLHGELHEGWREYEWRITGAPENTYIADLRDPSRILPKPSTLLPLDLDGKRILFLPEQGIGDEIFFLRFAKIARQRGAWTACLPSPKIASIVRRAPGLDMVISSEAITSNQDQIMVVSGITLPSELDHIFSVGDLPLILGADRLDDIPPPLQLTALPDHVSAIGDRLAALGRAPLLGVTWRAGTERKPGARALCFREADISLLGRTLSKWPGEVLILQRNPRPDEIENFTRALGRPAHDFSELNENLEDMLALLSRLDEYVGVHNTNMHLMAGLGKAARVLITHPPEWRDMLEGDGSPWFPGFQLYREKPDGGWSEAFARLTEDLCEGRSLYRPE